MKLLFGTAGIPLQTEERNTLSGIAEISKLKLGAMELEFVRNVNISGAMAPKVKEKAGEKNVILTCHGQYFINLNSDDSKKIEASKERILKAARIADMCGAWSLCFHAAFYMKKEQNEVYRTVRKELSEILSVLKSENNRIWIRPETTGKGTQFGTLDEILDLSCELERVMPCIDFSHIHARNNGKYNTYNEFSSLLEKVENKLGKEGLRNLHAHVSGIEYSAKGERNHLNLEDSDLNYKDLVKALRDFNAEGVVISESPNIEEDALLLKKLYEK